MIHGQTSIKNVISKVIRDLQYNKDFPWQNAIEWGAEALQHIGAYLQFEKKCYKIQVNNYKGNLPCDFHMLLQASYNNRPMVPGAGSFSNLMDSCCFNDVKDVDLTIYQQAAVDALEQRIKALEAQLLLTTDVVVIESLNNSINDCKKELLMIFNKTEAISPLVSTGLSSLTHTYWINPHHLKTDIESGIVFIAYLAIPSDESGFPLIPDDISYREALYRYITMKLMYPQYLQGKLRDIQWKEMVDNWHYYCKQARGTANMPDTGQLENIKNMWVRLIPNINQFDSFFNNLNNQENLNLGNNRSQNLRW